MSKKLLTAAAIFLIFFILFSNKNSLNNKPQVIINGHSIYAEIADTEDKRTQGLSDRPSLPIDHSMLFIFPQKGIYSFWMKDMKFSLDFIWIDGTKIVGLDVDAPAEGNSPTNIYTPPHRVDKVLEVNSGTIKNDNIKIGDSIKFINF